jgi:hypothetical protein
MTVATVPAAGLYRLNNQTWKIRHSERGNWYAQRQQADGTWQYYAAQTVNPAWFHGPLGPEEIAQTPAICATPQCALSVWSRNLCGMCLTREVLGRANRIEKRRGQISK